MDTKKHIKLIIEYLDKPGRWLTVHKFYQLCRSHNLRSRISDIRKMAREGKLNRVVQSENVKFRNGSWCKRYYFG